MSSLWAFSFPSRAIPLIVLMVHFCSHCKRSIVNQGDLLTSKWCIAFNNVKSYVRKFHLSHVVSQGMKNDLKCEVCKSHPNHVELKADRPHPHNYPHTPTDYRHTDNNLGLVMLLITLDDSAVRVSTDRRTDGRTDGRTDRQTLPSTLSPSLHGW